MSKMNYSKRFKSGAFSYRMSGAEASIVNVPRRRPASRSAIIKTAQANSLQAMAKKKDLSKNPNKVVPDKRDIKEYCRQDARFLELDEFIAGAPKRKSHVGVSAANTERVQIKRQILDDLPFGPILGDKK